MEIEQVLRDAGVQFIAVVLQALFAIVIAPLLTALAALAVVWVRRQIAVLKTRLTAEQFALAESLITTLVQQAEQLGITGRIADAGERKRQWVVDEARRLFEAKGIPFDVAEVNSLLEAAIRQGVEKGLGEIVIEPLP